MTCDVCGRKATLYRASLAYEMRLFALCREHAKSRRSMGYTLKATNPDAILR